MNNASAGLNSIPFLNSSRIAVHALENTDFTETDLIAANTQLIRLKNLKTKNPTVHAVLEEYHPDLGILSDIAPLRG